MIIPDPKAKNGDRVVVLNYRCRPPEWEEGECRSVQYKSGFGKFHWSYDVYINRGKGFSLHVDDDGIRRIKQGDTHGGN